MNTKAIKMYKKFFLINFISILLCAISFSYSNAEHRVVYENNFTQKFDGDIVLGNKDAKVTIIEYSSLSCPYCAKFHKKVMPKIKQDYIDSGKVKFIHRDSPLDLVSLYGAVALKCVESNNYYEALNKLFTNANQWAKSNDDFMINLSNQLKPYGIKDESHIESCLKNKALGQSIIDNRNIYRNKMNIKSTPTFFINDKKLVGYKSFAKFKKIIDKELTNKR